MISLQLSKKRQIIGDDEFFDFCEQNRDMRIERNRYGQILINMPTGSKTGIKNTELITELNLWNRQTKQGYVFDSSTGFTLPTQPESSVRSPDASWIQKKRWDKLTEAQQTKFAPICPDFVIELLSENDYWEEIAQKMQEYMACGCQLAWQIDADSQRVMIYRADGSQTEIKGFNQKISGENVLNGLELDLSLLL
ncbi:MAG: Uma2 family endonuclease [Microscillaceae bacterium]|jgi:Uma2 family endonuclease|nr:Uma2 family endonuclease [Microscillaceae bacterium]